MDRRNPPGRFYLRVGLGRKASGSYYTPHSFVRFLVQETLGPQVAERSPHDDPKPIEILKLKVLDPAMGSGHFLVEACRFLGEKLYEACRFCDEKALAAERNAEKLAKSKQGPALEEAAMWRQRITDLPDPEGELPRYLPSRSPEGQESGYSQRKAEALCRRLIATHCLYGVDKNLLAVELTKLSLWLESHAEGMPLTFLDHRLVVGDSLTGPFWHHLIRRPSHPEEPLSNLFQQNLDLSFKEALQRAIDDVTELEASVGISVADVEHKKQIKAKMDRALLPFRVVAAAWSGGVMLGPEKCDEDAYIGLLQSIAETGDLPEKIDSNGLNKMISRGLELEDVPAERDALYATFNSNFSVPPLSYDLTFPEVFYPRGIPYGHNGFNVVLGNPPWKRSLIEAKEFFASFDLRILEARTKRERLSIQEGLLQYPSIRRVWEKSTAENKGTHLLLNLYYPPPEITSKTFGATQDYFRYFFRRAFDCLSQTGSLGMVFPGGLHQTESALDVRQILLTGGQLISFFSFRNSKALFEIGTSEKFSLVSFCRGSILKQEFDAAFGLIDDKWLFTDVRQPPSMRYSKSLISGLGGPELAFPEIKSMADFEVAQTCTMDTITVKEELDRLSLSYSREFDMTDDSPLFERISNQQPDILILKLTDFRPRGVFPGGG